MSTVPLNEATRVGVVEWLLPPPSFRELYAGNFAELRLLHRAAVADGYVLAVFDPLGCLVASERLPADGDGGAVSVGRHSHVDLRLPEDPSVALRHALVRVRSGGGAPTARVIDLNTGQGIHVDGAGTCGAVATDGELFCRIGRYALMLFPTGGRHAEWPDDAELAWRSRPATELHDRRAVGHERPRVAVRSRETTNVYVLPAALVGPPAPAPSRPEALLEVDAVYALSAADLERGVLLGRYDRCQVGGGLPGCVSRVHLLLIKEESRVWAFDTGSSYGTRADGVPVRQAELTHGGSIELAGYTVRYRPAEPQN